MKYLIEKDKKRRVLFEQYEKKKLVLKALVKDNRLPYALRLMYKLDMLNFYKNTSKTRIKNRCVFSGRSRGIVKSFRMSRLMLKSNILRGFVTGIRKASW